MLRLWLLRHGQTDYNLQGIIQGGGIDSDLNASGLAQAGKFWETYKSVDFAYKVSSTQKRSFQTISRFETGQNTIHKFSGLNEMNWGYLEGKPSTPELHKEYLRLNALWSQGKTKEKMEGGESPAECWDRAKTELDEIIKKIPNQKAEILVCTHGRLLRIILSEMLGYGMRYMNYFPHENTGLNVLLISPRGKIVVEKLNDLSHLN